MPANNYGFIKYFFKIFLNYPKLILLIILLIIFFGFSSYQQMNKEAYPDLKIPYATITTIYNGASSSIVEHKITDKIEKELKSIDSIKNYHSFSTDSYSTISLEFHENSNLQNSMQCLYAAVNRSSTTIPKQSEHPEIKQISIRSQPILILMLYGKVNQQTLNDTAEKLQKKLARIPGINQAILEGIKKENIRIKVYPELLRYYNISTTEINDTILKHTSDTPLGSYQGNDQKFILNFHSTFDNIIEIKNLLLNSVNINRQLHLKDLADITITADKDHVHTSFSKNGSTFTRGIALSLTKTSGQDSIKLVDQAFKIIKEEKQLWKPELQIAVLSNNAQTIKEELHKTFNSAWQSFVIVFLVLFFLLTWREAAIAACAIPLTFLLSILILYLFGITFNLLVIIGMILALGLLVDDFILVMEGMHEGIFLQQLSFKTAATRTLRQYALPSLSGTLTTIITFLPLAFISGIDGKFLRIIPISAAICLASSYILSIFIAIPASGFLFNRKKQDPLTTTLIDRITNKIEKKHHSWLQNHIIGNNRQIIRTLLCALLLIIFSTILASRLPSILYPKGDGRYLGITIELPNDTKLTESNHIAHKLTKILRQKKIPKLNTAYCR